jgi:uncharacterized membrane protein YfcA
MDVNLVILFLLFTYFSEIGGTMAGFGSSTILLPLTLILVDFRLALVLVAIAHISGNLGRVNFFRGGLDKKLIVLFGIPSVLLTIIGAYMVNFTSQELLKLFLGIFLIIFAIISIFKKNIKFPSHKITNITGGAISGFLAGLIGTGGAIRGAFLIGFGLEKKVYIATAATIALMVDLTRLPVYFFQGFIQPQIYLIIPFIFIISLLGSYTGKLLITKIPQETFRIIVLIAIFIVGIKFIYDGVFYL